MVTPILLLDPTILEAAKETRVPLYSVTWAEYLKISAIFIDRFPRLTYLAGTLEIAMTTSVEHESLKKIITRL